MTSCCCQLTQLARMISINCHCCRMNFTGVSVIRKTRDDHSWWPECKAVPVGFRGFGVCLRSGENDCGGLEDIDANLISAEMCCSKMLESRL